MEKNIQRFPFWMQSDERNRIMNCAITEELIQENWHEQVGNPESELFTWNKAAKGYVAGRAKDNITGSKVYQILKENGMLDSNTEVLDVGCGIGRYANTFAEECRSVIDFSSSSR